MLVSRGALAQPAAIDASCALRRFPTEFARLGSNRNAFTGGFRLWTDPLAGKRSHRHK